VLRTTVDGPMTVVLLLATVVIFWKSSTVSSTAKFYLLRTEVQGTRVRYLASRVVPLVATTVPGTR